MTRQDNGAYAASVDELLDIVRSLDEALNTVVLVGDNPGTSCIPGPPLGRTRG